MKTKVVKKLWVGKIQYREWNIEFKNKSDIISWSSQDFDIIEQYEGKFNDEELLIINKYLKKKYDHISLYCRKRMKEDKNIAKRIIDLTIS